MYSDALRRLQGVTQVVSADEGWIFHNRLTHSIKVAQVARRIAEYLEANTEQKFIDAVGGLSVDAAETAGLAHDLGHPPFGHIAEDRLRALTGDFEGNAQSFRIVTKLEPHGEDYRGLDLTRATLNAILKYPRPRTETGDIINHKYGYYFQSEQAIFEFARGALPPGDQNKSLEAEIMDFADDVTFAVHDTEDFYRAGMIPLNDLCSSSPSGADPPELTRLVDDIRARWEGMNRVLSDWDGHVEALKEVLFLLPIDSPFYGTKDELVHIRRAASGFISSYILNGIRINEHFEVGARRIVIDDAIEMQLRMLKELIWTYVINRPSLATQQIGHGKVVEELFAHFDNAIKRGLTHALPPQFHYILDSRNSGAESDHRLAADMVCGLTDRQALVLFRRVSGFEPGRMVPFVI